MKATNSPFKHVFFSLNQTIYQWGKGWIISTDAQKEWDAEIKELLAKLKLKVSIPICSGSSDDGVNEIGENLYMHPMDFSGVIHMDNLEAYTKIINEFKSKYWSVKGVAVYDLDGEGINTVGSISQIEINKKKYLAVSK